MFRGGVSDTRSLVFVSVRTSVYRVRPFSFSRVNDLTSYIQPTSTEEDRKLDL